MRSLPLFVIAAGVLLIASPIPAQEQPKTHMISVTGDSEILVTPDKAIITLGVETIDMTLTVAKGKNDKLLKGVNRVAGQYGIGREDIQTDFINIEPKYEFEGGRNVFKGHWVRRSISVTLKDVSRFDDLLAELVAVGDIQVHGVQFQSTELRKYRDRARSMAVKAAFDKAFAMAVELHQKIGDPVEIREQGSGWYSPYNWYWDRGSSRFNSQNIAQAPSGAETPTAAGQISVTASVFASFEME